MRRVRGLGMENESNEPWGTCPTFFMRTARLPRAIQARGKAFFPRWHFDTVWFAPRCESIWFGFSFPRQPGSTFGFLRAQYGGLLGRNRCGVPAENGRCFTLFE
ncbi:hypothetical protein M408DRAFT_288863 [Serendipita vermifera MAFF 305830]|uniref:Uncharacterized protein n=1 Tax=Serendipita vermifera MAFF 305830 TaxID=933852 RepID=A0A0C3B1H1_SERVB|nr:hypothetical protein M408DRAFT_288863 [Serendipita vermifera MAFF 305830]